MELPSSFLVALFVILFGAAQSFEKGGTLCRSSCTLWP